MPQSGIVFLDFLISYKVRKTKFWAPNTSDNRLINFVFKFNTQTKCSFFFHYLKVLIEAKLLHIFANTRVFETIRFLSRLNQYTISIEVYERIS